MQSTVTFPPAICWAGVAVRVIFGSVGFTVTLVSTFAGVLQFPVSMGTNATGKVPVAVGCVFPLAQLQLPATAAFPLGFDAVPPVRALSDSFCPYSIAEAVGAVRVGVALAMVTDTSAVAVL